MFTLHLRDQRERNLVKSIGLDLTEIARIEKDLRRFGDRFSRKILGPTELTLYKNRRDGLQFLAGRFAAKEAVIKALGVYLADRPALPEIQIINDVSGQPQLQLSERVLKKMPDHRSLISITHDKHYAAAMAVFEEDR